MLIIKSIYVFWPEVAFMSQTKDHGSSMHIFQSWDLGVKYVEVNQLHYRYTFFQYYANKYTNLNNMVPDS